MISQIVDLPISKLRFNTGQIPGVPKNPRKYTSEQLDGICKSITDDPDMLVLRELIVFPLGKLYVVLGGNMRLRALKKLGYKEAPCKLLGPNIPAEKLRAFVIKDNLPFGEDDIRLLREEWDALELAGFGKILDIDQIAKPKSIASDDGYEMPDEIQVDVQLGDLVEFVCSDGRVHRLLCEDVQNPDAWAALMTDQQADMVITDPPYNIDYTGKTKEALKIKNDKKKPDEFRDFILSFYLNQMAYCRPGAPWYVWHAATEGHHFIGAFLQAGLKLSQVLVWVKSGPALSRQDYHWQHEPCLYGWKLGAGHPWYSDRTQTTTLRFDKPARNSEHPTMKPVEMFGYQIGNSSKDGDLVCDGFTGSGTSFVACHQMERTCYGMDLDPRFCQVTIDRMKKLDPSIVVLVNGEKYL